MNISVKKPLLSISKLLTLDIKEEEVEVVVREEGGGEFLSQESSSQSQECYSASKKVFMYIEKESPAISQMYNLTNIYDLATEPTVQV